jgi:hypothetical protein
MLQTYELYLQDDAGGRTFETLLCHSVAELMPKVRELISAREVAAIEVRVANQPLFTVSR